MKKVILSVFIVVVFVPILFGQTSLNSIANKEITFTIISTNYWQGKNNYHSFRKTLVIINGFNKKEDNFSYEGLSELVENLNDDKKDWASNLILYQLANKDASIIYQLSIPFIKKGTDRISYDERLIEDWRSFDKEEDIKYWKEWLNKKFQIIRA